MTSDAQCVTRRQKTSHYELRPGGAKREGCEGMDLNKTGIADDSSHSWRPFRRRLYTSREPILDTTQGTAVLLVLASGPTLSAATAQGLGRTSVPVDRQEARAGEHD